MFFYSRKFGDRYDGYRIKNVEPFFFIIPQVMSKRVDSQVFFSDELDITGLEQFVRDHTNTDIPGLRMYHVIIAAYLRVVSQRPYLNRFVLGHRLYQRNHLTVSMAIIRRDAKEETTLKIPFDPKDTLGDVVNKFNAVVEANKTASAENGTDKIAKLLGAMPTFLITGAIGFFKFLDRHGKLPKIINKVSPFHTSFFITNMGSLGIAPIYHHIYEFGTTSVFMAIGNKKTKYELDAGGNVVSKRTMGVKLVADERICEGSYYADGMRMLSRLLKHPEVLMTPPEKVIEDDGIVMKGRKVRDIPVGTELPF